MGPITPFITIVGAHLVTTYCTTSNWDDPPVVPVLGAPHPYIHYPYFIQMVHSMGFSGAPKNGIPYPYYSHTTPIRIPKDMGMVWEAYHKGVPLLGVPGITLDSLVVYLQTLLFQEIKYKGPNRGRIVSA